MKWNYGIHKSRNLETKGTQCDEEGCLSIPGESNPVERPNYVKVKAFNEKGEEFILEGEELLARAILHENDHLNGVLYVDHVSRRKVNENSIYGNSRFCSSIIRSFN